jgi:hypothetical protein
VQNPLQRLSAKELQEIIDVIIDFYNLILSHGGMNVKILQKSCRDLEKFLRNLEKINNQKSIAQTQLLCFIYSDANVFVQ